MSSYQEKALQAGADLTRFALGQRFLGSGRSIMLSKIDDQSIIGFAEKENAAPYKFTIDLVDIHKSTCICGMYLASHNQGVERRDKLCSHQIAGLISADNGAITVAIPQATPRQPRQANQPSQPSQSIPGQYSFKTKLNKAIGNAIENVIDVTKEVLRKGKHPFLLGPTGCGKTSAISALIKDREFWLELFKNRYGIEFDQFLPNGEGMLFDSIAGLETYGDADIVGLITQMKEVASIIARAFAIARSGKFVTVFCDEFKRFDPRVQNFFMTALLPIDATTARSMGIDTDESIYRVEAPVWGIEWAPVKHIIWIFGANEWGAAIDPAFARRVQARFIEYSDAALHPLDSDIADFIRQTWQDTRDGLLSLPIEYGLLSTMKNGSDVSIFADWLENLRLIDPALKLEYSQKIPQPRRQTAQTAQTSVPHPN